MPVTLLLGPAASGKTARCLAEIQSARQKSPFAPIWVVVPDRVQARVFRRRLAQAGGGIGVHIGTFGNLHQAILVAVDDERPIADAAICQRLLQRAIQELAQTGALAHFGSIAGTPGFLEVAAGRIHEFQRAAADPAEVALIAADLADPRLAELARIYARFEANLDASGWIDQGGLDMRAIGALESRPAGLTGWPLVVVDGFDSFDGLQRRAVAALEPTVGSIWVTLPGSRSMDRTAYRRFKHEYGKVKAAWPLQVIEVDFSAVDSAAVDSPSVETHAAPLGRSPEASAATALGSSTRRLPPLPEPLRAIERDLFVRRDPVAVSPESGDQVATLPPSATDAVTFLEVRGPAEEAREALRWLKARIVRDGVKPNRCAVITPEPETYRPFLRAAAAEFGLPIRFTVGEAIATTPSVAAVLDLVGVSIFNWPRRQLLDALRAPFFDWSGLGLESGDVPMLEALSRAACVVDGLAAWQEAIDLLAEREAWGDPVAGDASQSAHVEPRHSEAGAHAELPRGAQARRLADGLQGVLDRLQPPAGEQSVSTWVRWLEDLLDDLHFFPLEADSTGELGGNASSATFQDVEAADVDAAVEAGSSSSATASHNAESSRAAPSAETPKRRDAFPVAAGGDQALLERELAARHKLWEALRSLVLVESALGEESVSFVDFRHLLAAACQGTVVHVEPTHPEPPILVLRLLEARGPRFDAVAVVGLAEGALPQVEVEDPFVSELARRELGMEPRLEREQRGLFYLAATRADRWLLFTRPYLADDGAEWQASPYWIALLAVADPAQERVVRLANTSLRDPLDAASPEELLVWTARADRVERRRPAVVAERVEEVGATVVAGQIADVGTKRGPLGQAGTPSTGARRTTDSQSATRAIFGADPVLAARRAAVARYQMVLERRLAARRRTSLGQVVDPFEGSLASLAAVLADRWSGERPWSATRLEQYGTCPHWFWVRSGLELEPREEPELGLDARQRGTLMHQVLEEAHRDLPEDATVETILSRLEEVATRHFAAAPGKLGFRPSALWPNEQAEMRDQLQAAVQALSAEGTWRPVQLEAAFGQDGAPGLRVRLPEVGEVRLRGMIDRVDRDDEGRLRVIDYKSGSSHLEAASLVQGWRLQLPLYALAARDALGLGEPVEGFYWALSTRQTSGLRLATFGAKAADGAPAGVSGAIQVALEHVQATVAGVRAGRFAPKAPAGGCPSYCPAVNWCWQFRAGR